MKEFAYITDEQQVRATVQAVPLLSSFSDEQLEDVLNSSSLIECEAGDTIIKEGTLGSRIYVLLTGALDVRVGGKQVATIRHPGEVFGELALLNEDRRRASIVASEKSACLAIDQKFLQDIRPREEDPAFHAALYEFVARVVAKKLEATSYRLAQVERELMLLRAKGPGAIILRPRPRPAAARPKLSGKAALCKKRPVEAGRRG